MKVPKVGEVNQAIRHDSGMSLLMPHGFRCYIARRFMNNINRQYLSGL